MKAQLHENLKFAEQRRRDKAAKLAYELKKECALAAEQI